MTARPRTIIVTKLSLTFGLFYRHARAYADAVFFPLYFLFVWLWIRPAVIYYNPESYLYQSSTPMAALPDIYKTWSVSLASFYPGEPADYCGAALGHLFAVSWLGVLIITLIAWLASFLTGHCLSKVRASGLSIARLFPAIIILAQYVRYDHVLSDSISLLIALLGVLVYAAFGSHKRSHRFLLFIVLSAIVAVGSKGLMPFLVLCVLHEIIRRKSLLLAFLQVVSSAAYLVFYTIMIGGYHRVSSLWWPAGEAPWTLALRALLYASIPLAALTVAISHPLTRKFKKTYAVISGVPGRIALELIALSVTGYFLFEAYAPLTRNHLFLNYYLYKQEWNGLLREAAKRPFAAFTDFDSHIVDRALFHQGRLLDDLLSFPQSNYSLFLNNAPGYGHKEQLRRCIWVGWTLYEIGVLNNSENVCYEALAKVSHYPEGLRLLALIHMAKGMPEAAKTCLYALREDFVYRRMADDYLRRIENDPTLSNDPEIGWVRSIMLKDDGIEGFFLQPLLERNAHNQMAFEYMIAGYLLNKDVEAIAASTRYLPGFHYEKIPKLYEEALVINERVFRRGNNLFGMSISRETVDRFTAFSDIIENRYNGRPEDAKQELSERFGDSFFFYFLYGSAGRVGKP